MSILPMRSYASLFGGESEFGWKPQIFSPFPFNPYMMSIGLNQNQGTGYPNNSPTPWNIPYGGLYRNPIQGNYIPSVFLPTNFGYPTADDSSWAYPQRVQSMQKNPWDISLATTWQSQINQPPPVPPNPSPPKPPSGLGSSGYIPFVPSSQQAPKTPPPPKPPRIPNESWVPPARKWGSVNMLLGV